MKILALLAVRNWDNEPIVYVDSNMHAVIKLNINILVPYIC